MSSAVQDYFEGKIDFVGQQRVEEISRIWLFFFTALSFVLGFALQSLKLSFMLLGTSTVVLCVIVLPAWPMYNMHPVKWLPVVGEQTTKSS
ncbi:microsomal signal peptidase 12kDa subunit [Lentinula raphanica]|uniref:Signal peptidase complex subunit 1 n=1 Tax=Lentinula raphanica TaxID=153919 RepID=A0AA38PD85_9AGAR|nr:microsomal signal peptidase 12kDa subunit [Lentinula raphanica]KAJ3775199.1 microsomal signal peptidase 12kDa subunit [Lentinula raphanica]KAJ3823653.1 microsomal signal peptidase 12kDa subunit [Lentinula raphanica]KAJ3840774.1 microsomal signal peptidase 12kDa subunit [Lentinula raphanica]KAJ3977097.1 microsomal signal peptidase 12kDa subunit [Lentinula raphanica]